MYNVALLGLRLFVFALPTAIVSLFAFAESEYDLVICFSVCQMATQLLRFGLDAPLQHGFVLRKVLSQENFFLRVFAVFNFTKIPILLFLIVFLFLAFVVLLGQVGNKWMLWALSAGLLNSISHSIGVMNLGMKHKLLFLVCTGLVFYLMILILYALGFSNGPVLVFFAAVVNLGVSIYFILPSTLRSSQLDNLVDEGKGGAWDAMSDRQVYFSGANAAIVALVGWGSAWFFSLISTPEKAAIALATLKVAQLCMLPTLLVQQLCTPDLRDRLISGIDVSAWLFKLRLCVISGAFVCFCTGLFIDRFFRLNFLTFDLVVLCVIFTIGNSTIFSQTILALKSKQHLNFAGSLLGAIGFLVGSLLINIFDFSLSYLFALFFTISFIFHYLKSGIIVRGLEAH